MNIDLHTDDSRIHGYPAQRPFPWNNAASTARHQCDSVAANRKPECTREWALCTAWEQTRQSISQIREALEPLQQDPRIDCIFLTGSLARMEQRRHSDCDLIVIRRDCNSTSDVARGNTGAQSLDPAILMSSVWDLLEPLRFARPKQDGIYAIATERHQLIDLTNRGRVVEPLDVFGKRIQLMLDGQPVLHDDRFEELKAEILHWYLQCPSDAFADKSSQPNGQSTSHSRFDPAYLIHDLVRYFHALSIRTRWIPDKFERKRLQWKFDHSRLVCYAGLVAVLAESFAKSPFDFEHLKNLLRLTPLERLHRIATDQSPQDADELLAAYDDYLEGLTQLYAAPAESADPSSEVTDSEPTDISQVAPSQTPKRFRRLIKVLFEHGLHSWPNAIRDPLLLP